MVNKDDLIDVFEDTKQWYETDKNLKQAVANSIRNTVVFKVIEFAIYCTERDTKNYFAFYNLLSKLKF